MAAAVSEAVAGHLNDGGREEGQGRPHGREADGIVLKVTEVRRGRKASLGSLLSKHRTRG